MTRYVAGNPRKFVDSSPVGCARGERRYPFGFLWAWVSAAALAYFWKRRDVSVWETKVAPILSVLIMLTLCAVILIWYTDITGAGGVYAQLPWMIPVVIVIFAVAHGTINDERATPRELECPYVPADLEGASETQVPLEAGTASSGQRA